MGPRGKYDGLPAHGRRQNPGTERQEVTAVGNWAAVVLGRVCPGKSHVRNVWMSEAGVLG